MFKKLSLLSLILFAVFTLVTVSALTVPFAPGESLPDGNYAVERVIDGDTLTVLQIVPGRTPDIGSGGAMTGGAPSGGATLPALERSVRVLGIDTPEMRPLQPYAQEATDYARLMLEGQTVTLNASDTPVDRYGRALATVTIQAGQDFGLALLSAGYAETQLQGNESNTALYQAAQAGAKSVGKARWEDAAFQDVNCPALQTRAEAQVFFEAAATPERPDRHKLDPDKDGRACESLKH